MAEDDIVTIAKHAKDNGLFELPEQRRFERLVKREKKIVRMIRQVFKVKQKNAIKHKFGIKIPRNFWGRQ